MLLFQTLTVAESLIWIVPWTPLKFLIGRKGPESQSVECFCLPGFEWLKYLIPRHREHADFQKNKSTLAQE